MNKHEIQERAKEAFKEYWVSGTEFNRIVAEGHFIAGYETAMDNLTFMFIREALDEN
jgi:hypothetical protein